jgi:hypothetical protein
MRIKILRMMAMVPVLSMCVAMAYAQKEDDKSLSTLPRQFAATAFGQAGTVAGRSFGLNLYITGWTTNQQVQDYISILKEKGPNGLVSALEKTSDVGRVSPAGFVGTGFRFARYRPMANGGLHIVMVTNRPMSFGELYNNGRSTDYQFGIRLPPGKPSPPSGEWDKFYHSRRTSADCSN